MPPNLYHIIRAYELSILILSASSINFSKNPKVLQLSTQVITPNAISSNANCHRTVQIIPIKCTNPPFKLNPQLLHSTSTPRLPTVTRIDYMGTLAKRRAHVITSKSRVQINLQTEFNTSFRNNLQQSFTIQGLQSKSQSSTQRK